MRLPITITLQRSRRLIAAQAAAHAVAACVVVVLALPWPVRAALFATIGVSLLLLLKRQQQPILALHLGAQGTLEIETKVSARARRYGCCRRQRFSLA